MSIYDSLNPQQKQAVMHQYGPLLLLAGAGSGKTRVITHRIARLIDDGVAPYHILALTFTNKAAQEMRDRVDHLVEFGAESIWVGTFHSVCGRILRRSIDKIGYESSFAIYDTDDQKALIKEIMKYLQLDPKKFKDRAILSAISNAKNALLTPEAYEKSAQGDYLLKTYASVYQEYQKRLQSNNALDFDDMIFRTIDLFRACPEELKKYQQRFQYIHVDEYQDTNYAQFELIRMLAPTEIDGDIYQNLCVVGDDDQSIYKFRGANIYNILNFEKQFPNTAIIKLEQNYRSTGNILSAANEVIKHNTQRKDKSLWTKQGDGEPLRYCQLDTDFNEADYIISDIAKTVADGAEYQDIAILYRTNAQSRLLEEKLVRSNIPYKLIGGINFYQRKEIKDLLCYLKTIDNGRDDLAVKRIINVPKRGIGQTSIDRVSDYAIRTGTSFYDALRHAKEIPGIGRALAKLESFVSMIETLKQKAAGIYAGGSTNTTDTFRSLLDDILEITGYEEDLKADGDPQVEARLENIEELKNKIAFYEQNAEEIPTLSAFLEEVSLVADVDSMIDSTNVVVLMTLHSAKGLEFPYVYLAGMEDGVFPGYLSITSDDPTEIEEERRLCYVGITRAMKRLTLTGARQRMQHGETQFNKPSRFVHEIPRYLLKETTGSFSVPWHAQQDFMDELPAVDIFADVEAETSVPWEEPDDIVEIADYSKKPKRMSPAEFMKQQKKSSSLGTNPFAGNPYIKKGISAPPLQAPDYQTGDQVRHIKFGTGTVMELVKGPKDYQVTVDFGEGTGVKKMMAGFAKLKKI